MSLATESSSASTSIARRRAVGPHAAGVRTLSRRRRRACSRRPAGAGERACRRRSRRPTPRGRRAVPRRSRCRRPSRACARRNRRLSASSPASIESQTVTPFPSARPSAFTATLPSRAWAKSISSWRSAGPPATPARGRDPGLVHQLLGEELGALDPGRRPWSARRRSAPAAAQASATPASSAASGPTITRSIWCSRTPSASAWRVGRRDRQDLGEFGHPGVAWGGEQRVSAA